MSIIRKILKMILWIVAFILTIILSLDIVIYNVRDISSVFISEEEIKKAVSSVNVLDLLKDESGNELKQITELKTELVSAGVPVETVESFINSEPIKEVTTNITNDVVQYIFYGKDIEIPELNQEEIFTFLSDNTKVIVAELQKNNVPKSELLTEEKQTEILNNIKEQMPVIEEKIDSVITILDEKIKQTDEYEKLEEAEQQFNQMLSIVQFIYSDKVTTLIWIIFITCIIGIILCKMSFYSYLKWIGFASILSGSILFIVHLILPKLFNYLNMVPYVFQNLFTLLLNDSISLFLNRAIPYFIIGGILIILNIIVWFIIEKIEDKKIDL